MELKIGVIYFLHPDNEKIFLTESSTDFFLKLFDNEIWLTMSGLSVPISYDIEKIPLQCGGFGRRLLTFSKPGKRLSCHGYEIHSYHSYRYFHVALKRLHDDIKKAVVVYTKERYICLHEFCKLKGIPDEVQREILIFYIPIEITQGE